MALKHVLSSAILPYCLSRVLNRPLRVVEGMKSERGTVRILMVAPLNPTQEKHVKTNDDDSNVDGSTNVDEVTWCVRTHDGSTQ
jgi:hypothetical protein